MRHVLLSACLLLAAGCGGDSTPAATFDGTLDAWRGAGLEPVGFEAGAAELGATECRAGTIAGLAATVCEYPDAAAARKAEEAGLAKVGAATGASIARGRLLLVMVDRDKVDPQGRTLNKAAKTFRGLRPTGPAEAAATP